MMVPEQFSDSDFGRTIKNIVILNALPSVQKDGIRLYKALNKIVGK